MSLKVSNLSKKFKNNAVLSGISFEVNKGQVVSVIGPSGAGKTTLIRCINGLEKADGGNIQIGKHLLCSDDGNGIKYSGKAELAEIRKEVGYVFQNFNLFPHMTVLQNVMEAPVQVANINKEEAEKGAVALLDRLGILEKAQAYPFELSGGQKQRVAIARACALNPVLMCFDEPTSALDPESQGDIALIIEGLARQGMAILIITHDMTFAKRVSDRIIFLDEGAIKGEGTKVNTFKDIDNERIMQYINR